MQHEKIRQLEDAQAHLSAGRDRQERLVWLRARQIYRRVQHRSPWLKEQMELLIADIDDVKEHIIAAQDQVVAARGSRKEK